MRIANRHSILFTGDSITDCGRARPARAGAYLGDGYVARVDHLLAASYPARFIRVLNTGISGNTILDLEARWHTDVLDLAPDWLSVMIGINDVWQQFSDPPTPRPVTIAQYRTTYQKLLQQTRPGLKGLVLMTPYVIERSLADPMRERLHKYGRVVAQLAREFDAVFVDVQAAFDGYLAHRSASSLCEDRIHPNQLGHIIIAKAFLTAIRFDWYADKKTSGNDGQ